MKFHYHSHARFIGWQDLVLHVNAHHPSVHADARSGIHIIRNPLDIVVSAYYSHLNTHPVDTWPRLKKQRELIKSKSAEEGIKLTAEFLALRDFDRNTPGPLYALRHWDYADSRFKTLRMEDVVDQPNAQLGAALLSRFPGAVLPDENQFTFQGITGRKMGDVDTNSHYRDGRPGQWRQELPKALADELRTTFAPLLQAYYPQDV